MILTIYTDFHTFISKVGLLIRIQTEIPKNTFAQTRQKFCCLSSNVSWQSRAGRLLCSSESHRDPSSFYPVALPASGVSSWERLMLAHWNNICILVPGEWVRKWEARNFFFKKVTLIFLTLTNSKDLMEKLVSYGKFKVFYYEYEEWKIGT